MKIKIRSDSVEIEGYVNAVERVSKPLWSRVGQFIERICAGAFKKALRRNNDVKILLNHDWNRALGGTLEGNLELEEDNIGLHARAVITDPEVIEKARAGKLRGWSFGFDDRDVENRIEDGMPLRLVRDLDLAEVSILDDRKSPAYAGTLVSVRSIDGRKITHFRAEEYIDDDVKIEEEKAQEKSEETREEGENTDKKESQEKNDPVEKSVEKPVEKTGNMNYNKVIGILNDIKEEL